MTKRSDVIEDPNYTSYLDHGFVGLVEVMGSDQTIEESARMSYGKGTRSVSETRNLLRYLIRNYHTSPLEMGELRFHLKIPIVVMRQFVRHRTASLNEYSGRYSEMVDEFYVPSLDRVKLQSKDNKQGSGEVIGDEGTRQNIQYAMGQVHDSAYGVYQQLLEVGVARELARNVLPVSNYTELYWKCDVHNFMKMLVQRLDPHAQEEIRGLAEIMYQKARPHFPICFDAFEDYWLNGESFSDQEMDILRRMLGTAVRPLIIPMIDDAEISKREKDEFKKKLGLDWKIVGGGSGPGSL